jgi:hypothetical protein
MKHLTPKDAATFLQDNPSAVFIDCAARWNTFVGHPVGVHHVA